MADTKLARIRSIDLLRGADVLLMLFVNEVAGVAGAPAFLRHKGAADDGMTITDLVFPAFLFVVGMAIPFALGSRLARGESRLAVLRHVVARAAARRDRRADGKRRARRRGVAVAARLERADDARRAARLAALRWRGRLAASRGAPSPRHPALALVVVAYRGKDVSGWLQLRPYWWGILGLIGWAYLGVASLYLVIASRPAILTALSGSTAAWRSPTRRAASAGRRFRAARGRHRRDARRGRARGLPARRPGERHLRSQGSSWRFAAGALGCAAAFGAAGLLLHTLHGLHAAFTISKIHATLPWGLLSAALTTGAWVAVFVIADVLGGGSWPKAVQLAGENPLLAYLLAPLPAVALRARRPALRRRQPLRGDQPAGAARPRPFGGLRVGGRAPDGLVARSGIALSALTKGVRS